ncbi:YeiH family protein [Mangrovicoccus ximenensis]|uniref:YeiH family protein n=1 Tax=Mangrovicoccus ximenensis TaxID=1911570 RepID=UPI001F01EBB2|nr:putative sulfate exporter family transporter [Mangrovicoccus ximenensis]
MIRMCLPDDRPPPPDAAALCQALEAERICLERRRSEQWLARDLVDSIALRVAALAAELDAMALRNTAGVHAGLAPGIGFALKKLLRLAIVLLGLQLTLAQIGGIGPGGIAAIVLTLAATLAFTKAMGRVLGVEPRLAELIAAGTSVCGASAILACNTVTRGRDEDVAYAIACVTVFGSLSMILFPLLAGPLGLAPQDFGLWAGASIHEVAQVVGTAFAGGEAAGQTGTIAKLSRVILLAPVVLSLGLMARRRDRSGPRARCCRSRGSRPIWAARRGGSMRWRTIRPTGRTGR